MGLFINTRMTGRAVAEVWPSPPVRTRCSPHPDPAHCLSLTSYEAAARTVASPRATGRLGARGRPSIAEAQRTSQISRIVGRDPEGTHQRPEPRCRHIGGCSTAGAASLAETHQCLDDLVYVIGKRPAVWQKVWRGVRELGVAEISGVGEQSTLSGTGRRKSELDIEFGD